MTPGIKYVGVDFVRPKAEPGFEFYQCDFNTQALPTALAGVELVTCSGILEYIEDLPGLLAAIRDATRPNTRLIITYSNMNHISRVLRLLRGLTFGVHPDWRNFFSPRDVQRVISEAGFRIERALPVDVAIFAAAVADWRVANAGDQKLKKQPGKTTPELSLVENPDILASVAKRKTQRPKLVIGFAAETENVAANAKAKLASKGCDWILANDVSPQSGVMGGDRNTITLVRSSGVEAWPPQGKDEVAATLIARIADALTK
jgi:hypothetical protein